MAPRALIPLCSRLGYDSLLQVPASTPARRRTDLELQAKISPLLPKLFALRFISSQKEAWNQNRNCVPEGHPFGGDVQVILPLLFSAKALGDFFFLNNDLGYL